MPVDYSIIVPAYKEAKNLEPLTKRVFAAVESQGFAKGTVEMIIVDDNSRDGSVEKVQALREQGYNVDILVRTTERGLSSAVIHGFNKSKGRYMIVMDADLQHPPESVPEVLRAFEKQGTEYVLGTRYGKGVSIDKDWPLHRRIISWGARLLARPLTSLSDPMSGFFGIRRDVFVKGQKNVSPIGYKIAMELFVKCGIKNFQEVAFPFGARLEGESKLTGKVIIHYLKHLRALYLYSFGAFCYVALILLVIFAFVVLRKISALIL